MKKIKHKQTTPISLKSEGFANVVVQLFLVLHLFDFLK